VRFKGTPVSPDFEALPLLETNYLLVRRPVPERVPKQILGEQTPPILRLHQTPTGTFHARHPGAIFLLESSLIMIILLIVLILVFGFGGYRMGPGIGHYGGGGISLVLVIVLILLLLHVF
jgi:hypothetical protein